MSGLILTIAATLGHAQEATLKTSAQPHYAGEPIIIQVEAQGFDGKTDPECTAPVPTEGQLDFIGLAATGERMYIVNGRATSYKTHGFRYHFTAVEPGRYRIGPFVVRQGSKQVSTEPFTISLQEIPISEALRIRVILPETAVYVGQRVPVRLEWWFDLEPRSIARDRDFLLGGNDFDFRDAQIWIHTPLFFNESFDFIDVEIGRRDLVLPVMTSQGRILLRATGEKGREFQGRSYYVFTAERTLVPVRAGEYEFGPATVSVATSSRRRRSFFDSHPSRVERIRNIGEPRRLIVKAPPLAARPPSYAGGIGKGFAVEVTADRTVVQAGDPITLTLMLRGDGNLENAGLPDLGREGGLPAHHFRLSDSNVPGIYSEEEGTKRFTVPVRVLSDSVREIPPIAYSWFDVDEEQYHTTYSKPIALSVRRAEVVGADAVVSSAKGGNDAERGTADRIATSTPAGGRPRFTLVGADLALAGDRETWLRADHTRFAGRWTLIGLYVGPLILIALAIVGRRRARIDPRIIRRRKALQEERRRIQSSLGSPRSEGTHEITNALRTIVSLVPSAPREDLDRFLAECETIVYAPANSAPADSRETVDRDFHRRALELADRVIAENR